jgi:hypothetical protein
LLEVVAAVDDLTALHSYALYRHRDANNPGIDRHRVFPSNAALILDFDRAMVRMSP